MADSVELEDTLKDGVVENMLIVLADGGRLAAIRARAARRRHHAPPRRLHAPARWSTPEGCPKEPTWQINAVRVVHDPVRHRISYQGATLNLFGMPILGLPGLSHPDGSQGGGTGVLVPEIRYSRRNGLELSVPYYLRLAPNRDAHHHPARLHRRAADARGRISPADLERRLPGRTAMSPTARGSRSTRWRRPTRPAMKGIRAYIEGGGRLILSPEWTVTAFGRYATDRTFMRRYDISRDDRLRSFVNAERITDRQLHLDRRLGVRGPAADRRRGHAADRPARDRRALADRRSGRSAARSSSRPTASPSCAPKARTASAPSPARAGTGA